MSSVVSCHSSLRRQVFLAAIVVGVPACSSVTAPENELARARQLWADRGPTSYSFTMVRSCFCIPAVAGPVVTTVENGAVVSRVYVTGGAPVPTAYAAAFPPIEGVFDVIADALRDGADRVEVSYDPSLGYPVNVSIDYFEEGPDDELGISVSQLNPG